MRNYIIKIMRVFTKPSLKGFVLPFTMLISVLILFIVTSAMSLLSKQLYFSKLYKQSQAAYYAADDAVACAIDIDDAYVAGDGLGIFPSATSTVEHGSALDYIDYVLAYVNTKKGTSITLTGVNAITCAQSAIFDNSSSNFQVSSEDYIHYFNSPIDGSSQKEYGAISSYKMRMNLGGGNYRCAKVTVNKTQSFRQIIGQGYATCDDLNTVIERAVVNTTTTE